MKVISDTGSRLELNPKHYKKVIVEHYQWHANRRKTAQMVAECYGLQLASARQLVKKILDREQVCWRASCGKLSAGAAAMSPDNGPAGVGVLA